MTVFHLTNICTFSVITDASKYDNTVDEYSIFSNECDQSADGNYLGSYWNGRDQGIYEYINIDLQIHVSILSVDIKNGHNAGDNDRSTKDFALDISQCGYDWTRVVTDILENAINQQCPDITTENYPVNKVARYVRFMALGYHQESSGSSLQYLHINVDFPASVQSEDQFLCPGN